MKHSSLIFSVLILISLGFSTPILSKDKSWKVFSKRADLPLLEKPDTSSKSVAKAIWNEALEVDDQKGRWLKVRAKDGEGWVYSGNVSSEPLPPENHNDLVKTSGITAAAAGRGLTPIASEYASRHDYADVAKQIEWLEKVNAEISKADARNYLKTHKMGEFAEVK